MNINDCPSLAPANRFHPTGSATHPTPTTAASQGRLESPEAIFGIPE